MKLGFKADQKISEVLRLSKSRRFTLSAEVIPPRNGAEQGEVLDQVRLLVGAGAEFLAVTKGAGGSLRSGTLPIALAIKEQFSVPCIAHFTCRDSTPQEVENQLIDHHYFGVRNVLALRGDPPTDQADWQPKPGSHLHAYQLMQQIRDLNAGRFLARPSEAAKPGSTPSVATDFCIGAAAYPDEPGRRERIDYFKMKVGAGAEYAITQMLFDADTYARFVEECAKAKIAVPILPGTRLLRDKGQAQRMAARFKVRLSPRLLAALPDASTADLRQSLDAFHAFIGELRKLGAPGLHLFVLSDTEGARTLIKELP